MYKLKLALSVAVLVAVGFFATVPSCSDDSNITTTKKDSGTSLDAAMTDKTARACSMLCQCDGDLFSSTPSSSSTSCQDDCVNSVGSAGASTSTQADIDCVASATTCAQVNNCIGFSTSTSN